MRSDSDSIRRWALLAAAVISTSQPATSLASTYRHGGYYTYTASPVVAPNLAKVRGDYFSCSVGGMQELCRSHPDLCASPDVQARLNELKLHRNIAYSLYGTAGASFAGGLAYGANRALSGRPHGDVAIYSGLGLGIVFAVVGAVMMPRRREHEKFINLVNSHQADKPVNWHLGMVDEGHHTSTLLSVSF